VFVRGFGSAILSTALVVGAATAVTAQQAAAVNHPYDGIQAGLDAFRLAEEKRQGAVSQQLSLNDQMRFWNGYPTSRGQTTYYGYMSPAAIQAYGYGMPVLTGANLDYTYGYGAGRCGEVPDKVGPVR